MKLMKTSETIKTREKNFYSNFIGHYKSREKLAHLRTFPVPIYPFFTAEMNSFEKQLFKENVKFDYHLSGYGRTVEEANISLMGESTERFAFVSQLKQYKMHFSSYNELQKQNRNILDFEYINVFNTGDISLKKDDEINWVEMYNINNYKKKYIPAQLVMPNIANEIDNGLRYITETVSTGTASHENFELALESAILEILQLDSFNMWWYQGYESKELEIDYIELFKKYDLIDKYNNFFNYFTIKTHNISFDKAVYVIAVEIESKKDNIPKYTVGLGAGMDLEYTIYRSILECMTIVEYNFNIPWIDSKKYQEINTEYNFNDLDANVIFYSKYGKPNLKFRKYQHWNNSKVKNLSNLLTTLPQESYYSVITTPDFNGLNNETVRVIIPEYLPMAIPQMPPINHPKYKEHGMMNAIIHPLP